MAAIAKARVLVEGRVGDLWSWRYVASQLEGALFETEEAALAFIAEKERECGYSSDDHRIRAWDGTSAAVSVAMRS